MIKENLIGNRYGKLIAKERLIKEIGKAKTKTAYYRCICNCGEEKVVRSDTVPQFLIREFTDSTGHIHTDIEKARTNETLSIVEAEGKEEARKKVEEEEDD